MKEWALNWLAGSARSCVRRIKSISLKQLSGVQQAVCKYYGVSVEESVAAILKAVDEVPNPDPGKLMAVTAMVA